ncbi:site-specific integrase [Rubrobacter taiwanensis]|jgi:integrase|uniref:Site-specific integrase n=1 Tax=Rubrobacter taiwanensis TaxID=185139 RepID=A0A4R1BID4_9ACTN|nr:site-specific integrase [Rubrobacter taiwanensis]TCJ16918.1 site-specific integrase [Rubrobacter taiwanensis]
MARKRGNGEGSIYKHRRNGKVVGYRGAYFVYTADGPKRRYVNGKDREEVRQKLTKAMADRDSGIVVDDKNLSVGEYLDRWLFDCVRGTVRESTFSRDGYLIRNHIKPALGRIRLKNLNALHLQGFYRGRLDSGLSGSTVQKIHHVLHKGLAQAVKWDLIPRNPADAVKAPSPSKKEMHPLSADEARRLLEAARGDRFEALYVLAVYTGMRCGELLGLKWEDIDLDNHTIRVRRTLTRTENGKKLSLGEPKTKKSRRTVKLYARVVEVLKRHRARQAEEKLKSGSLYRDQNLVFAGENGGLINPSNLRQRSFLPLLRRAGLPQIRFHDLRHTCASLLFQRNVHPKFVQELLGHASVAITLDTYSHMLPGMGGEVADTMGEALG